MKRRQCAECGTWFKTVDLWRAHRKKVGDSEKSRHILKVGRVTKKEYIKRRLDFLYGALDSHVL